MPWRHIAGSISSTWVTGVSIGAANASDAQYTPVVGSVLLAVSDDARVDDDRFAATDHHRVQGDDHGRGALTLVVVDQVGVRCEPGGCEPGGWGRARASRVVHGCLRRSGDGSMGIIDPAPDRHGDAAHSQRV